MAQKYEYMILRESSGYWKYPDEPISSKGWRDGLIDVLNSLGDQGWELAGTLVGQSGGNHLYFKRPKP